MASTPSWASDVEIRLGADEVALLGYGSLTSVASIERTLGREYDGRLFFCRIAGWRRTWNVGMPNAAYYYLDGTGRVYPERILYLNVRRNGPDAMNALLFVVTRQELASFDEREWIYTRVEVGPDLRGVRVTGGPSYVYVGRDEYRHAAAADPRRAAVRGSYVRMVDRAVDGAGVRFRLEFDASTDPLPRAAVIEDVLDPERPNPWTAAGRHYAPRS